MTLSANTNVIAAPQRGGDRAPQHPAGTVPAGRQQDARGTIDRRAEGATYSPTLPTSGAAALHPKAGVRRARELSPSLRSQSCQHAQPVEGYGHARSGARERLVMIRACSEQLLSAILVLGNGFVPIPLLNSVGRSKSEDQTSKENPKLVRKLCAVKFKVIIEILVQPAEHTFKNICHFFICTSDLGMPLIRDDWSQNLFDLIRKQAETKSLPNRALMSFLLQLPLGGNMLVVCNHHGSSNCSNRSNCLHPSRGALRTPGKMEQAEHHKYSQWRNQQQPGAESEVHLYFIGQHARLLGSGTARSLQAPCHHVQRCAA